MYSYNDFYRQSNIDNMNYLNMMNPIFMNNTNMSLFTPTEGYEKGNMFSNLYSQYKNYVPEKIVPKNNQEKLMLEINENLFAAHELNLYLDIHPEDNSMITLFNDYRKKAESLKEKYESLYGPLCLKSNALDATPFLWEKNNFPWEGGNI